MSLPLKFYRAVSYIQLVVSGYAFFWLGKDFSSSISCSAIDNRASVTPYLLRYGKYFIPECSSGGTEWIIGNAESVILRILFIAWIVISLFVFIRIRNIRKYVSESEPVEFIQTPKSKKKSGGKGIPLFGSLKDLVPSFQIPRLLKIILSVTSLWILMVLVFQGSILNILTRYVLEQRFTGEITNIDVRYSKDGLASVYLHVDQNLVLLRSDKNIHEYGGGVNEENGLFIGLEQFQLDDVHLSECLIGQEVEVFAKKSGIFYSLDNDSRYSVRFTKGAPTCQSVYLGACINGKDSYEFGEKMYYEEEGIVCECTPQGFACENGTVVVSNEAVGETCRYFGVSYNSGQSFSSEDQCAQCNCDDGTVTCAGGSSCESDVYEVTKDFEVPLYYWFIDEPDPSRIVTLTAGKSDSYEVVAYKPFGQSPKTEFNLSDGVSSPALIFTDAHQSTPIWTSEIHEVTGNESYPGLIRAYSNEAGGYVYAERIASQSTCTDAGNPGEKCILPVVDGVNVICKSLDGGYGLCDQVMATFGLGE